MTRTRSEPVQRQVASLVVEGWEGMDRHLRRKVIRWVRVQVDAMERGEDLGVREDGDRVVVLMTGDRDE